MILYSGNIAESVQHAIGEGKKKRIFALCDTNTIGLVEQHLAGLVSPEDICIIPNGEQHKNLSTAEFIWNFLSHRLAKRNALLINLGGGMVTDIGGFSAATYMRGIDFINVPSSLLAMVDAAVGGKNGINLGHLKNLVGTFYNPRAVIIHPQLLQSLPNEELASGWGEVMKHGIIAGGAAWSNCKSGIPPLSETRVWMDLIRSNIEIKAQIVASDPLEKGPRKILNLGHTIAHALETLYMRHSGYLSHGNAVAIGLVLETAIAAEMGMVSNAVLEEVQAVVAQVFPMEKIADNWMPELLQIMQSDKKNESDALHFSLPSGIGKIEINVPVSTDVIASAIARYHGFTATI